MNKRREIDWIDCSFNERAVEGVWGGGRSNVLHRHCKQENMGRCVRGGRS